MSARAWLQAHKRIDMNGLDLAKQRLVYIRRDLDRATARLVADDLDGVASICRGALDAVEGHQIVFHQRILSR